MTQACFALLDDADASAERPTSRLYSHFVREHACADPAALDATWAQVDADLRAGLHAVLLADYEWGARLLHAGDAALADADGGRLRVLMFAQVARLSRHEVDDWLARRDVDSGIAGATALEASVDRGEFEVAIARIHDAIRAGETYQVNYTYRLAGRAFGSPVALFRRLRARQPVRYRALIALPSATDGDGEDRMVGDSAADGSTGVGMSTGAGAGSPPVGHVLSCSPELFLRHEAGVLTAMPMKGTASRVAGAEGDSETARHLAFDTKNRAENLMIVDLLRNDLGRLAQTGSVNVPRLFDIEPYATVFQMTSTVQARVRPAIDMPQLLRAVFPCGSITGAPKHHTMALIAGLESTPRGLYCGAIGWVDAPAGDDAMLGDFCLSVAIRTLTLGPEAQGSRPLRLGVGAGIVLDSVAADEFDECRLKARFLTGLDPGFALFETLLASREAGIAHLPRHLARLEASAAELGFAHSPTAVRDALAAVLARLPVRQPCRLRLTLQHDGRVDVTHAPLTPLVLLEPQKPPTPPTPAPGDGPVGLLISPIPLPPPGLLSRHKTTARQHYDDAVREAERQGAFDMLFFTADGRLAEGARSNVLLQLDDGRWWTPPVADGALPGVMRAVLLADPAWGAAERTLNVDDLRRARAIVVCNALRGPLRARVVGAGGQPS